MRFGEIVNKESDQNMRKIRDQGFFQDNLDYVATEKGKCLPSSFVVSLIFNNMCLDCLLY